MLSATNLIKALRDGIKERMQESKEIEMTNENKDFKHATHCFKSGDISLKFKKSYKDWKRSPRILELICYFSHTLNSASQSMKTCCLGSCKNGPTLALEAIYILKQRSLQNAEAFTLE